MDYFSRSFKSVLGGAENTDGPTGAETVERLVDRVSSATLLEDRRDAVRAIKSLSKKFRLEVGTSGMGVLINILNKDRSDAEICGYALDSLVTVMSTSSTEQPNDETLLPEDDLAIQFTEIFLKESDNITCILELLEEYDFRVRWPAVKLLISLLNNRAIQIQQHVLVSPLGVSRLMDLLSDSREVIRNDGLLLLIQLTRGNAAIQKIVAFENAFDKLLEVLAEEGYSNGGIITEDCLTLMSNLFNASNINFFREGSYIQRLVPYFNFSDFTEDGKQWNEQKVKNVISMLKLVRCLVSPSNPPQSTLSSQKILNNCQLLKTFCDLLMTVGIPAEVLTETVNTVAEIIRGNETNQAFFSVVDAPYTPPKPAIVVLLMSMISDKQPFPLRCAVLYCFQCYLYKNTNGQSRVISTLLPSGAQEANNVTAGQLLCGGLFSADSFSNWCAAAALSHALSANKELKEQLLRVQLATGVESQPVSLLQQCTVILSNGGCSIQTRSAILSLLCNWLTNCSVAVGHLLSNSAIIPFLFATSEQPCEAHEAVIQGLSAILIGVCVVYNDNSNPQFTSESIKRLISTRLDPEHFLTKINEVSKTEPFTLAAKHTQIQVTEVENILFDHEFTRQFKKLEVSITRAILDEDDTDNKATKSQEAEMVSYKELIREQDEELQRLRAKCAELEKSNSETTQQLERQAIDMVQLRNQVSIMKDYMPAESQEAGENKPKEETINSEDYKQMQTMVSQLELQNNTLQEQLSKTQSSLSVTQASLEAITTNKQQTVDDTATQTNQQLQQLQLENQQLKQTINNQLENNQTGGIIEELRKELKEKETENIQQKQDQEDLLVLLEDQDGKIKRYKLRLRELGDKVADDSTDDDSDVDDVTTKNNDVIELDEPPATSEKQTVNTTPSATQQNGLADV